MKKEKRDLIRNSILLSIFILINIFLIIVAQSPQLTEIKQGTNLIIRFVFFGVMLLFIAVVHVDYYLRKDKKNLYYHDTQWDCINFRNYSINFDVKEYSHD